MSVPQGPSNVSAFGSTAIGLAKNPLGVISLFLVLVYGLSIVGFIFAEVSETQRTILTWFVALFPIAVLLTFGWLVSRHNQRLYAPQDFRDESNWVRMQLEAVASLTAAKPIPGDAARIEEISVSRVVDAVQESVRSLSNAEGAWRGRILWVDDRPDNNRYERHAFEAIGFSFMLEETTASALRALETHECVAIISDMGRREGPNEGYVLLDALRSNDNCTPFFIYAGSRSEEHRRLVVEHGGQGTTDRPSELLEMVVRAVGSKPG